MHEPFNASHWLVDRHVESGVGDRVAIIFGDQTLTYADVQRQVIATAKALQALGIKPEQRVAMAMLDSPEFVAVFLGAMRLGAIPVAMNPLLPGRDLAVIARDARAQVAVVSAARAESIEALAAGAPEVERVVVTDDAGVSPVHGLATDSASTNRASVVEWSAFQAAGAEHSGAVYQTWVESPGFWLCTSGSTGQPKLAMHRHGDIPVTCEDYAAPVLAMTPEDRFFSVGPMFHAYGLGNSLTFPFSVGATVVLESTRPPTPQLVADIVSTNRATLFFCIPTFYAAMLASDISADTFASVRWGVSAAEPLPAETFERFREKFGVTILDGIGSTELLHIYLSNTPDRTRGGTSGVELGGYALKVIDEEGNEQPAGTPGELVVSGRSMATGYWCRSDTTRATFEGQWMRTGDLYSKDSDGFYTYMGRVDDMLKVSGEWVSPAEVEGALIEHPGVLEAAIVGDKLDDGTMQPVAYVIAANPEAGLGTDELSAFCKERLAGYKRPKRYEFVADLPKTATGKIQRFKLRS